MKQTKKLLAILLCLLCLLPAAVPVGAKDGGIRNVILMIGDGMGYNHLKLAEEQGYEIFMDDAPDLLGWSRTRSASSRVTDSAAGATALACGVRTNNHMLGVYPSAVKRMYAQPRSLTENAILHGMKTGIVTTDLTSGATPSGFSVHSISRDNTKEIVVQQLQSKIDLIWGSSVDLAQREAVEQSGFTYLATKDQLFAFDSVRSYGQFPNDLWKLKPGANTPTLAEMSKKAFSLLSQGNQGFFLMIEGAHIDKKADDSQNGLVDYPEKINEVCIAVKGFDNAVREAVDFARSDGHTLVIITADHETGRLTYDHLTKRMTFHSSNHTAANVPVFVYGADDLFKNGAKMDNRRIPNLIAKKLGWNERFPIGDPVDPDSTAANPFKTVLTTVQNFFQKISQTLRDFFESLFKK